MRLIDGFSFSIACLDESPVLFVCSFGARECGIFSRSNGIENGKRPESLSICFAKSGTNRIDAFDSTLKKTHAMWTSKYLLVVPLLLTTVLLVNAGELKEAWTNADLSDASASKAMSMATSASTKQKGKKVVVVQINNDSTKAHPLYLIDGKKVSAEAFKAIDPNKIKSVTV